MLNRNMYILRLERLLNNDPKNQGYDRNDKKDQGAFKVTYR